MDSTQKALRSIYGTGTYWSTPSGARMHYQMEYFMHDIPILGSIIKTRDHMNYMDDYLRNRNLDYSKVLYPTRTISSAGWGSSVNFVSSNIARLYR